MGLAAAAAVLCCAASAWSNVVASWDFNGLSGAIPASIAADTGHGTLSLAEFTGGLSATSGTTINAAGGAVAGQSLAIAGQSQNGRSIVIDVETVGWRQLELSMAALRSGTGFASVAVQIWDGLAWNAVGSVAAGTSQWQPFYIDLAQQTFADNGSLRLRLQLSGATSANGNVRLDNLRIDGIVVPAPGAAALAGAALARRRRRP
jgi:type 1 fimbria pilin